MWVEINNASSGTWSTNGFVVKPSCSVLVWDNNAMSGNVLLDKRIISVSETGVEVVDTFSWQIAFYVVFGLILLRYVLRIFWHGLCAIFNVRQVDI